MDNFLKPSASFSGYLLLVLMLLLLPLRWVIGFVLAVFLHEGGHWIFICFFTRRKPPFLIGSGGVTLYTGELTLWQEMIVSAAGPAAGLSLLLLLRIFPEAGICGLFHAVYNLLPIYPLDGGRILRCLCSCLLSEKGVSIICGIVEVIAWMGVFFAGVYGCFALRVGVAALAAPFLMIARLKKNTLQRSEEKGTIALP